jgi:hypothetical protein
METSHQRTERVYLKLLFGILIGIVLLVLIFWGGHDLYARWQERRLVRRAVVAIQHGDDATASLAARSVLQIKPSSGPASRIMAELAEKTGNRAALDWRHKVVEAEPQSVDDALAWARCALQFDEIGIAEKAMSGINEQGKQQAGYHAVAGALAQGKKDDASANREWELAVQLAPSETAYQLQLATLQLHSANQDRHAAGKTTLNRLREEPKQRAAATRALIADGIARHATGEELVGLARDLQSYPEATVSDRLIYLDFLHQVGAPEFTTYLSELERSVSSNPGDLAALLQWMSRSKLNLVALDYLKGISPETLTKWPLPLAIADLYAQLKDWRKLEETTKNSNWREGEFIRHAYLARALRAQDKLAAAEHEWALAVKDAESHSSSALALVRVTDEWNWDKEMVDLLWSLTTDPEKQRDAVETLYQYYLRNRNTQGLYRTLVRWKDLAPNDLNVQNNLAQVSLLLDADRDEAQKMAADLYHKEPTNAAYVATYAYSLLTKGDANGAAKVMNSLTPEQLRDPSVSAYYGICLAAVHDEKARDFLATGQQAVLLPEEKKLIDKALANLNSWRRIQ